MIAFAGVLIYLISSIIRPADWWEPMRDWPVDYMIFGLIFVGIAVGPQRERLGRIFSLQTTRLVLLYIGAVAISTLATGNLTAMAEQVILYANLFCVYLAFAVASDSWRRIRAVLFLFVLLAAFLGYAGRILAETGVGLAGQGLYWAHRIRWVGMYDGANVLCMLFAISAAIALEFVLGPRSRLLRALTICAAIFIVWGIYLTNSRGGFLALLTAVGIAILLRGSERLRRIPMKRLIPAAVALVLLLGVAPSRMESMNDQDHSAAGRIDAWQEGLEMLRANPLLGVGSGQWLEHHYRRAHNSLVQTMGELGLLGLFAWLAMLYSFCAPLPAFALRSSELESKSAARATLGAFTAFLCASFFISTTTFDLPFIFGGLSASMCELKGLQPRANGRIFMRLAFTEVALVTTIYVMVRVFYL